MDLIFCKLQTIKNMNLTFCEHKTAPKVWIQSFTNLKELKKHKSHFLQA